MKTAEKFKLDFLIAGAVFDFATFGEEKEASIYLIDVKKKDVKEIKATYKSSRAYDRTGFLVRANFYRAIYDQIVTRSPDVLEQKDNMSK
jgi:hypothetical protein